MFSVVLFITGIYTAVGFNLFSKPVKKFANDDLPFGQTIIQSRDGVFVPSPTSGDVFNCTDKRCAEIYVNAVTKGLRPTLSVVSSWSEDKEQLLVCNQVRTINSAAENFNRNCTLVSDHQEKSKVYPNKLVLQLLEQKNMNSNNNNNKYQGTQTGFQDHSRKRRALQSDSSTDTNEEDQGTEIAVVLDGSGSIKPMDFERAKDFIYTLMKNVWRTCFNCKFAVVQFGSDIRTELSLKENNDRISALDKVKNIQQINELTKTASALYHVLTDIFVPESGSKENAKKIIILLSDGQMSGDTRNLTEVLNMPQMEGVVCYAIGVGPNVLNYAHAIKEMTEISGNEDRFFGLCNYAALETLLSSLEKSIIRIDDAGIEIAFVLDGSGSIEKEDFTRAKDFISNMMKNVWATCFSVRKGSNFMEKFMLYDIHTPQYHNY